MFNLKEKKRDSVLKYQENLEHYEKINASIYKISTKDLTTVLPSFYKAF